MFVCTTCRDPEHGRVTDPPFEGPVGGSFSHRSRLIRPASHGLRATSLGHSERFLGVSLGRVIQVGSEKRRAYVMLAFTLAAICLFIVYRLVPVLCTGFVAITATMIGVVLARRTRLLERLILTMSCDRAGTYRKLTRAERRAIAARLSIALKRTELRSLFPTVADRADHIAEMIII